MLADRAHCAVDAPGPIFVRAGTVLPLLRRQTNAEAGLTFEQIMERGEGTAAAGAAGGAAGAQVPPTRGLIEVHVFQGNDHRGELFDDANGESVDWTDGKSAALFTFAGVKTDGNSVKLSVTRTKGTYRPPFDTFRFVLHRKNSGEEEEGGEDTTRTPLVLVSEDGAKLPVTADGILRVDDVPVGKQ